MNDPHIVIWVGLFLLLLWCAFWHIRENRFLARQWHQTFDPASARWLTRFAWSRSLQLFATLICCTLIIITYDWQLNDARQTANVLNTQITSLRTAAAVKAAPVAAAATTIIPAVTIQPADTTPILPPTEDKVIEDIYNPEEKTSTNQAAMDSIKKRYEEILVTYFFLKKCNRVNPTDYHVITSALSQEMASVNAPGRLQNDILTAAQGSYKEMYAQSNCDDKSIDALHTQYNSYIVTVTQQYNQQ